jgi:hypothetical protein
MICVSRTHRSGSCDTWPTYYRKLAICLFVTLCTYSSVSQTLQGSVQDGTTGAAQSGDLVVVVSGNEEVGRTATDEDGHFMINASFTHAVQGVLAIRVLHEGVTYSHPVRFDSPVSVAVYDTSTSREQISEYMCVLQFQTGSPGLLEVTELHAIKNDSWPPRTVVNADNFRLSIPIDARDLSLAITEADGQGARLSFSGNEIGNAPKALAIPLEPGLTKYVIKYSLPYNGHFASHRLLQYRTEKLFLIAPPAMQLSVGRTLKFRSVEDHTGAQVREVDSVAKNNPFTVQLRGNGILSQAFSPLGPDDNNLTLPLGSEVGAHGPVAPRTHAQIAAATDQRLRISERRTAPKRWSTNGIVLGCAVLLSIVMILGKAVYVRKARQST